MGSVEQLREKAKTENDLINNKAYIIAADPTKKLATPEKLKEVPYIDFSPLLNALLHLEASAKQVETSKTKADEKQLAIINSKIYAAEQLLLTPAGLPRRPWYKHSLYAPGFYTGYGVKTVPGVREAIEQKNWAEAVEQINEVAKAIEKLSSYLDAL